MKKILFLIIVGLACNAMAQKPHKATGDKPLYSEEYDFEDLDSIKSNRTYYTYNNYQRIIKEIVDYGSFRDSIITTYDTKGRTISVNQYYNDELENSEVWIYDETNSRIEYTITMPNVMGITDPLQKTIYYGVKDMDATQDEYTFSTMMGNFSYRDCDSIYSNVYDATSGSWTVYTKMYPVYQNGHITQATMIMDMSILGDFGDFGDLPFEEIEMDMVFTYQNNKLTTIKASTSVDIGMGFPIPLTNFMVVTNQYNGDFLTQTTTIMDISFMGTSMMYQGMKEIYLYNNENNILCAESYSIEEESDWMLETKVWYFYTKPEAAYDDLAILNLNNPFEYSDEKGKSMRISVNIENKSDTLSYSDVEIRAIILNTSGDSVMMIRQELPAINPSSVLTYWFDEYYTVPDDQYTLKIFIDSYDDYPFNDTLRIIRQTHNPVSIICCSAVDNGFFLEQNFPNPARNNTIINYSIPQDGEIIFNLFSISGQLLYNKRENASLGQYQINLDLSGYASGIYFYTMEYKGQRITKRMSIKR